MILRPSRSTLFPYTTLFRSFQNDAFLIFRGTVPAANLGADVVTDLRIGLDYSNAGHIVHSGFNQTFTSMIPSIQSFLDTHNITGRVHCVGHSLGGAVATLAAEWISANRSNAVKLYTFGAPKVGFAGFSKNLTDRIKAENIDRKSTRLNSSHVRISYAVFCLKKKKKK